MFRSAPIIETPAGWWNSRWFLALLVVIAIIPLILPTVPPLTDLPEHMGRYRIMLADGSDPLRRDYFSFEWGFIANLGVDLLVIPLAPLFGLELAVKLIVIGIAALTASGILWIAHEAHGRVPPTTILALSLAYSFPFIWGFVNFLLSMALALNAFALWLRLGRQGRWRLRIALFVPIGLLLTVAHIFGWAVLSLLAFAAETVRMRDSGRTIAQSIWHGGLACLALAPPVLLMVLWRTGDARGANTGWFDWHAKYVYALSALRNTWMTVDLGTVYLLFCVIVFGLFGLWLRMNRTLGIATVMLITAYILLPRMLFGSAYADMRLAPYLFVVALAALALKSGSRREAAIVAGIATAIFVGRIALLTRSFAAQSHANEQQLQALDHVRPGSRVFVQVALRCTAYWVTSRMDHLGAMAIVRRGAFVNGQWTDPGAQLVRIKYAPAKGFAEDPTEILRPAGCRQRHAKRYPDALNTLPRDAFDYAWVVNWPRARWNSFPGLVPIWTGEGRGILYRVIPPQANSATRPSDTPTGSRPRTAA
ncbi:hypothetical protein [uncultured Sphingomonas sp.]|uniref:hypothetical protein n=1 Tax=uncultured Sphingomonas sp. TaxID=158754 RepID=UPI0025FB15DD|nr:hypothetical protein [uncultured Sphingomonas sp.]